jgi:hypothetical protein
MTLGFGRIRMSELESVIESPSMSLNEAGIGK